MLQIITGKERKRNTGEILAIIRRKMEKELQGNILIVPEQFSFEAEQLLCRVCGNTVPKYAEVLSFSRLTDRMLSIYGGKERETLDDGGRFLTMLLTAESIRTRLKYYGAATSKPETVKGLISQIEELRNSCVLPRDLKNASTRFEGLFAQKLEELSELYEGYLATCANSKADPMDKLERLADMLAETDFAKSRTFYFDGFNDFTLLQQNSIRALLKQDCELVVSLVCDASGKSEIFDTAGETLHLLKQLAKEAGVRVEITQICEQENDSRFHYREFMLDYSQNAEIPDNLRLAACADHYAECEYAVSEIRKLLMSGVRCREISVVCTEQANFYPTLKLLTRELKIPAYFNENDSLAAEPMIVGLFAALNAVESMEEEPLFTYLQCPISFLSPSSCNDLQDYVKVWGIRGKKWNEPFRKNPKGYDNSDNCEEKLIELEQTRLLVTKHFDKLRKELRKAENTAGQIMAVYRFLKETDAEKRIMYLADQRCDEQRRRTLEQVYPILISALEQMYLTLGNMSRNAAGFTAILRELITQYHVKTIPAYLDAVSFGSFAELRYRSSKYLFVLGAEEGTMPKEPSCGGILTDYERNMLRSIANLPLSEGKDYVLNRDINAIYDTFCSGTVSTIVTYSGTKACRVYERLSELKKPEMISTDKLLFTPLRAAAEALRDEAACTALCQIPSVLEAYGALERTASYALGALSPTMVEKLYGKELYLSASKIDNFASCQRQFFLKYGLKLRELKEADIDASLFGTMVHRVMEKVIPACIKAGDLSEENISSAVVREISEFLREMIPDYEEKDSQFNYLLKRNKQEIHEIAADAVKEIGLSDFRPEAFELTFGKGKDLPPECIAAKGGTVLLEGSIDRVDLCEIKGKQYVRVIDYKTGKKEIGFEKLEKGIGLQMLLYLFALKHSEWPGHGRPNDLAGVMYFPARSDTVSFSEKPTQEEIEQKQINQKMRSGLLLGDENVLHAMERYEDKPIYLPITGKKAGEEYLLTEKQFALLERHVRKTVETFAEQIFTGQTKAEPYVQGNSENACSFCSYKANCAATCEEPAARKHKRIKAEEFWKRLEERENGDGFSADRTAAARD